MLRKSLSVLQGLGLDELVQMATSVRRVSAWAVKLETVQGVLVALLESG